MKSPCHIAALEYAQRGWFVLPVWWPTGNNACACGDPRCINVGKHPITTRGQHDATIDPQQIDAWWAQYPTANVGIALAPSGLVAFDIDKPEAYTAWQEIEAKYGEPKTLVQVSGSGCHHVIFKRPPFAIRGVYDKRITLRGNNFIVAAPSLHKSGGSYHWQEGSAPWQVPPAELAPALADVLKRPEQAQSTLNHDYPVATPEILKAAQDALMRHGPEIKGKSPPGHTRTAWGILVNDFALSDAEAAALMRAYNAMCSPPWPEDKLFSSPCRSGQPWNNPRGAHRDRVGNREQMEIAGYGPPPEPPRRSELLENVARTYVPPMTFYSTGFPTLDRMMSGGFATRHFCGFIGPPSAGKSALIGHWLLLLSKHRPVLHVSTELPRWELFVRYAAHEMRFPWVDGIKGVVPQPSMVHAVVGVNIRILGCDDLDRDDPLGSIEDEVKRMTAENNGVAPIVAIDYIQNMAVGASSETRFKVGELCQRARIISQVYDTVVIGVFSTQRAGYSGKTATALREADDPTAYLGAAKESGDIEFHCATLMYLDVEKLHTGDPKPARIAVARCRVGAVGFVGLRARLAFGEFTEDPAALTEMSTEARKARAEAQSIEEDCKRVYDAIKTFGGQAWGIIQGKTRLAPKKADAARDVLLVQKVIRRDDDVRKDGTKVPRAFTFWVVADAVSPSSVAAEDDDDDDSE